MGINLISFDFNQNQIRTLKKDDGSIWFIGKDVCDVLEHSNSRMALNSLDDDEKDV